MVQSLEEKARFIVKHGYAMNAEVAQGYLDLQAEVGWLRGEILTLGTPGATPDCGGNINESQFYPESVRRWAKKVLRRDREQD